MIGFAPTAPRQIDGDRLSSMQVYMSIIAWDAENASYSSVTKKMKWALEKTTTTCYDSRKWPALYPDRPTIR